MAKDGIVVVHVDGMRGWMTRKKAQRLEARGAGRLIDSTLYLLGPTDLSNLPNHLPRVTQRAQLAVSEFKPEHELTFDSGFSTSRYPLPLEVTTSPRFPALARMGAGLR